MDKGLVSGTRLPGFEPQPLHFPDCVTFCYNIPMYVTPPFLFVEQGC